MIKAIAAVATSAPAEQQANVPAGTPADLALADLIEPRKSCRQARADAIVSMAEHCLATGDQHGQWQGLKGSERCQVDPTVYGPVRVGSWYGAGAGGPQPGSLVLEFRPRRTRQPWFCNVNKYARVRRSSRPSCGQLRHTSMVLLAGGLVADT